MSGRGFVWRDAMIGLGVYGVLVGIAWIMRFIYAESAFAYLPLGLLGLPWSMLPVLLPAEAVSMLRAGLYGALVVNAVIIGALVGASGRSGPAP